MTPLFHVSDDPGITRFEPRPIGDGPARVWAIDAAHLCNYLLPRDCPRLCFRAAPDSTADDLALLDGAEIVIAIEAGWEQRVRSGRVYVYDIPEAPFTLTDANAGYWCATEAVTPLGCTAVTDLPAAIAARKARLLVLPSLWPLHDQLQAARLTFSMIRLRNATPR